MKPYVKTLHTIILTHILFVCNRNLEKGLLSVFFCILSSLYLKVTLPLENLKEIKKP